MSTVLSEPRILIVAENTSARFGGEAVLPWHYFRLLRKRGIEAWLITHTRTQEELLGLLPEESSRIHFLPDTAFNKLCWFLGGFLPASIAYITFGYASRFATQMVARRLARRLVREHGIDVIHQPTPVSPREPSLMHGFKVPVIMGPMNGNMTYPPAFVRRGGKQFFLNKIVGVARFVSHLLHLAMPGKLQARVLLVANERTRQGLPARVRGSVTSLVENGVDLDLWLAPDENPDEALKATESTVKFFFLGRLVDWKAVDILLEAFSRIRGNVPVELEIVGDGPMRSELEERSKSLGLSDRVLFTGWKSQIECAGRLRGAAALALPSLYECGGAVVLEAMACGVPVIATEWGGPASYLDDTCGILVPPTSREDLIQGFADAMTRLANDPQLRSKLGQAGREHVVQEYDWERKIDQVLTIYRRVSEETSVEVVTKRGPSLVGVQQTGW